MRLRLRPGISFCAVGDRLIFLDVQHDRYFCLSRPAEQSFQRLAHGYDLSTEDHQRVDRLREVALLTGTDDDCLPQACAPPPPVSVSLIEDSPGQTSFYELTVAFSHLVRVRALLRMRSLEVVLGAIVRAKGAATPQTGSIDRRIRKIATAFRRLNLVASPLDQCLPRSLAVATRCLAVDIVPTVVIGVKLQPFGAHCWIQHGDLLINERIDGVRDFTPILVI
jgi:hypothetical protein